MLGNLSSRLAVTGAAVAVLCAVTAAPAWAAKPSGGGSGGSALTTGIDVSYPQCGATLPTGEAFAVIGVNGGLANDYNSCLSSQWTYASRLTKTTSQPAAQAYLNTGDAGNSVADWPSPSQPGGYAAAHPGTLTSDTSGGPAYYYTTSGNCAFAQGSTAVGDNSPGCAYIYGYDMVAGITYTDSSGSPQSVVGDAAEFHGATNGGQLYAQPAWLDIETSNSWQPQTDAGYAMNIADLQGMVDAIRDEAAADSTAAAPIGLYTTASQWQQITGLTSATTAPGNLGDLPVWIPGARTQRGAASNCSQTPFNGGGTVSITQWFTSSYDADYSCAG